MRRLVGLYPADWQARYGPEFEAILETRPPSVRDRVDIVRGAIDARIHPQGPGAGDPSPAPHPVGLLPGVLLALGGLSWAIAALIVATARITPALVVGFMARRSRTLPSPAATGRPGR